MERDLHLDHHISQKFNEELEAIRKKVLKMGGLVEKMIEDSITAIVSGNSELAQEVMEADHRVNGLEVTIDEDCTRILARRQPTASDLRLIIAVIKTITDLERIGDEAEKLAYLGMRLSEVERPPHNYRELQHLGDHVRGMVNKALDTFARMDAEDAVKIALEDEKIDEEYEALTRQCITFMMEEPRSIRRVLDVTWCARALERIGDHAKNICEYVVYLVEGKDIRHTDIEQVQRNFRSQP